MPHTHSRFQQDLGFVDGIINYALTEVVPVASAGGPATIVRNGPADLVYNVPVSTTETLSIPLFETLILRSGFPEDLQNAFGSTFGSGLGGVPAGPGGAGTGIPGSAEPQGRPDGFILPGTPQPASGMSALQEITPRTALKLKGIKPLALAVKYKVLSAAATALTCRLDTIKFANGVANVITNLLASGANGLNSAASATPYVTVVSIPNAVYYQIADLTEMWFELGVQTPSGGTFQFYGVRMLAEFNYN
jgi:hypothetical protein